MEVIMFPKKMWCVGILILGFMAECQAEVVTSIGVKATCVTKSPLFTHGTKLPLIAEVATKLEREQIVLIEEIFALVQPHISLEEMDKLWVLLQKLASKVKVQTLLEIHKKLKMDILKFGTLTLFGLKSSNNENSRPLISDSNLLKIQTNLVTFLGTTDFRNLEPKQRDFIRKNAQELSKIISSVLKQYLPDCLHDLAEVLETLKGLEQSARLQAAITQFVSKHQ